MASLQRFRSQIDRLDQSLLRLLNRRGQLVQEIGTLKQKNGQAIFAPGRERDLLAGLRSKNSGPLSEEAVESVFREIVHACRSLQKQLQVAYLGPEATFTHLAALRSFGRGAQLTPVRTIPDVFAEVEKGRADYGVVPIENSTEGVVNHTLDMFIESTLSICAERELPIWHYLLGKADRFRRGRGVKVIFSHYQPLAQCRQWLEAHLPGVRVVEASSTAEAARLASRTPGAVAIASRLAAELYGLDLLASRIEDVKHNFTRFFVVGTEAPQATGRDKTSIMFSIKDRVGALHDMLIPFRKYNLNLSKIESRPLRPPLDRWRASAGAPVAGRERAWQYIFFVDFEGHRFERRVQKALQLLERSCVFLKVLGSYPRTE